jgi:hypothetical protein
LLTEPELQRGFQHVSARGSEALPGHLVIT